MTTCPTCGQEHERWAPCAALPAEPFPLHEFAPELASAARVDGATPARPVLEIVRPPAPAAAAETPAPPAGGSELPAIADPAAVARSARDRSRGRLPTGIRLVIGRRRKAPSPRRVPEAPAPPEPPAPPPAAMEPPAPASPPPRPVEAPPPARSHPALQAQARLFDEPAAEPASPAPPPPPAAAPAASAPDPVGGLLGAFAAPPDPDPPMPAPQTALAPASRPLPPVPRPARPVRAERLRVRDEEREPPPRRERTRPRPAGPTLGERLSQAGSRVSEAVSGPAAILALAAVTVAGTAIVAPPVAALLVSAAAWLVVRREDRAGESPSVPSERLTAAGLACGALVAAAALLARAGIGGAAAGLVARPGAIALPLAVLSLAVASAAAIVLARRFRAAPLASVGVPLLAATAGIAIAPAASGFSLAAGALAAAAAGVGTRGRLPGLRDVRQAWLVAAALAAGAAALLAVVRPPADAVAVATLLVLGPAAMVSAQGLSREYERDARRAARVLAASCALSVAAGLTLSARALGPDVLALLPLAGLGHAVLQRVKERLHQSRLEAPWLPLDGRIAVALGAAAGAAVTLTRPEPALPAALLLAATALTCGVDADLVRRPAGRLVPPFLGWLAITFAVAAIGLPWRWIPAVGAGLLGALVGAAGLAAKRARLRAADLPWTWPTLASAGGALAAAVVACSAGAWISGGAGIVLSASAPLALRLLPRRERGADPAAAPAATPLALTLSLAVLAPAAPLLALGHVRWAGPLFAGEALAAWAISRRRPEAQAPLGALLVATLLLLPFLASRDALVAGTLTLAGWLVVGALESGLARRVPSRGTRGLAAAVAVGSGLGLTAWLSAAAGAAPVTMLLAAAVLQAADRLTGDAVLGRALRSAATVSWLAGIGLAALLAVAEPLSASLLLVAAALTALIEGALRRDEAPALAAGLAGAGALACACLHVGISAVDHPAVYLAPAAAYLVAWGVLQASRRRSFRAPLGAGLFLLAGSVVVEAHLLSAPPLLRPVAAALAATMIAGGVLARHRAPVLAGAGALALEAAWLLGEGALLVAKHPLPGLTVVAGAAALVAAAVVHLAWRAGGRMPLLLAWTSDWARLRDAWSRWS